MVTQIEYGYFKVARKIKDSQIWREKPAWWLKVWIYILDQVKYHDGSKFPAGTNFFRYNEIYESCHLYREGITRPKSLHNVINWMKSCSQVTTLRTTRGIIITVCNYKFYQNGESYRKDTAEDAGKDTSEDTAKTLRRHAKDSITKESKKDKNKIHTAQEFFSYFCTTTKQNLKLTDVRKRLVLKRLEEFSLDDLKKATDVFSKDDWTDRHKYMDLIYCIGTIKGVDNLEKWLNNKPTPILGDFEGD